jgi:hypothetical protein
VLVFSAVRWYTTMSAALSRHTPAGEQYTNAGFRSTIQTAGHIEDVDLDEVRTELTNQLERFVNNGSSWCLDEITKFTIHFAEYRPLTGSSYIATPDCLEAKHAIVNVQNKYDNFCFQWAILSALFPVDDNAYRVTKYEQHVNKLNWSGLKFPVSLPQIRLFERQNTCLTVNVYVYKEDNGDVIPVYITKHTAREKHVDLLLFQNAENSHYVWIKNMSALVHHRTKAKAKTYVCPHCVRPFSTENAFNRHFPDCSKHCRQKIVFPGEDDEKEDKFLTWKSYNKTEMSEFIIYADFESCLKPVEKHDKMTGKSYVVNEHVPAAFCAYTVSKFALHRTNPVVYVGEDCMDKFFDYLLTEQRRIACILGQDFEMLPLTLDEQETFDKAKFVTAAPNLLLVKILNAAIIVMQLANLSPQYAAIAICS